MTNFTGTGISLLKIDSVRSVRDNATYECVAENGVGDAVTSEATLLVYDGKSYSIPTLNDQVSDRSFVTRLLVELFHNVR